MAQHILIIDDHTLYRAGLRLAIGDAMPTANVAEAGSLSEALQLSVTPDAIVLDVKLQGLNGLEGMPLLRRAWPDVPVLVLSSQDDPDNVRLAQDRGAAAFVSKGESAETITATLRLILKGELPRAGTARATLLTARQYEVLDLLCKGLSNKSIAQQLSLSENTVRCHVQAIFAALRVTSRSEAAFAARRDGLIG